MVLRLMLQFIKRGSDDRDAELEAPQTLHTCPRVVLGQAPQQMPQVLQQRLLYFGT